MVWPLEVNYKGLDLFSGCGIQLVSFWVSEGVEKGKGEQQREKSFAGQKQKTIFSYCSIRFVMVEWKEAKKKDRQRRVSK